MTLEEVLAFLCRAGDSGRIVAISNLTPEQAEWAHRDGRLLHDTTTGYGWALLPWDEATKLDSEREVEEWN